MSKNNGVALTLSPRDRAMYDVLTKNLRGELENLLRDNPTVASRVITPLTEAIERVLVEISKRESPSAPTVTNNIPVPKVVVEAKAPNVTVDLDTVAKALNNLADAMSEMADATAENNKLLTKLVTQLTKNKIKKATTKVSRNSDKDLSETTTTYEYDK